MYAKTEVGNVGLKLQEAREHIFPYFILFLGERDSTTNTFFGLSAPLLQAAPCHCYKISTTVNSSSEANPFFQLVDTFVRPQFEMLLSRVFVFRVTAMNRRSF